jgi:hypothetical protein
MCMFKYKSLDPRLIIYLFINLFVLLMTMMMICVQFAVLLSGIFLNNLLVIYFLLDCR